MNNMGTANSSDVNHTLVFYCHYDEEYNKLLQLGKSWIKTIDDSISKTKKHINDIDYLNSKLMGYDDFHKSINKSFFTAKKKNKYNDDILQKFNNIDDAKKRLFCFRNYNVVINGLKKIIDDHNLEILIGGSSVLSCAIKNKKNQFEPNDIDIYVKNITNSKIIIIDTAIQSMFNSKDGYDVYIVRREITLTWWILKDGLFCTEIQLNLYDVSSWTEIFTMYHSDLVCIGYDIKNDNIIIHKDRWNTFAEIFVLNGFIYMTNSHVIQNKAHLESIIKKYCCRNFNVIGIINYDEKKNEHTNCSFSGSENNKLRDITKMDIFDIFKQKYSDINFFVDTDIKNVLVDVNVPKMMYMMEPHNSYFMDAIFDIELDENDSLDCPIYLNNINIIVQNTACEHYVSVNSYVKQKNNICPLCRTKWNDSNMYISDTKTYKKQMETKDKSIGINLVKKTNISAKEIVNTEDYEEQQPPPQQVLVGVAEGYADDYSADYSADYALGEEQIQMLINNMDNDENNAVTDEHNNDNNHDEEDIDDENSD